MLVWGGYNGSYLNSGGRFDPVANTWKTISTTSAPTARIYHSAVWAGIPTSQMIVWGGLSSSGSSLSSGGHYNPATDTWLATGPASSTLIARYYHTSVWADNRMITWGGYSGFNLYPADAGRYVPYAWDSISTNGAPSPRALHTAVWDGIQNPDPATVIVWGGINGVGGTNYLNDGGQYSPIFNSWSAVTTSGAPAARDLHTAVWTGTEMLVWGGYNGSSRFNDGGKYNPISNGWTAITTADAPAGRDHHTAVWTGSKMIIWGGWNGTDYFNDGARYNPTTDTWTPMTSIGAPLPRYYHTAVWTGSEMIVWGGYNNVNLYLNDGARYNPTTDTWTPLPTNSAPSLSISLMDPHTVIVSWPSPATGHWLEENNDLSTTNWISVSQIPNDDGITKSISIPASLSNVFYRLK